MRVASLSAWHELPALTLSDLAPLPGCRVQIFTGSPAAHGALGAKREGLVFVAGPDYPGQDAAIGVVAAIMSVEAASGGLRVELEGRCRARRDGAGYAALAEPAAAAADAPQVREVRRGWLELAALRGWSRAPAGPAALEHMAARVGLEGEQLWAFIRAADLAARLAVLQARVSHELAAARAERAVRDGARKHVEQVSRGSLLRSQLQWIESELYDDEEGDLRRRLEALPLPPEMRRACRLAFRNLQGSFEDALTARAYLDFVATLPWGKALAARPPAEALARMRSVVWGGGHVADRLADVAYQRATPPVLCLAGPPGVGKTHLAERFAACLGIPFAAVALGGVRGEAILRGSPGAGPGLVMQALARAGSFDALVLLDDVDKVEDPEGSVWAALLGLLEPAGRARFVDRYLGQPVDLSRTMFWLAANDVAHVPGTLRDRAEVLWLRGYDDTEKRAILRDPIWPRAVARLGARGLTLTRGAEGELLQASSQEAGVRDLQRAAEKTVRRWVRERGGAAGAVGRRWVARVLQTKPAELPPECPGRVYGLAWTPLGGAVMPIETVVLPGAGGLRITGRVGEIMGESAQAAYTWLRLNAAGLGLGDEAASRGMHIHFPEAATPKDGASAGLTLVAGMASALRGAVLHPATAFTGEITVMGEVLPVGGVREKLLAAIRAGIEHVVLPAGNRAEALRAGPAVARRLRLRFVNRIEEAFARSER